MMQLFNWTFASLAAAFALATRAHGALISFSTDVNETIPNDGGSLSIVSQPISVPPSAIADIAVHLNVSGGLNGSLYAYLRLEDGSNIGFSVLLNRPGVTAGNPIGYTDAGMNIVLSDSAVTDIHLYGGNGGNPVAGTWLPDARNVSPFVVTGLSPRTADLSSFNGLDPNGTWTLYLQNVVAGSPLSTLESWGLDITTVPEPSTVVAGAILLLPFAATTFRSRPGRIQDAVGDDVRRL